MVDGGGATSGGGSTVAVRRSSNQRLIDPALVSRIFLTLSVLANASLIGAFALGWIIDDPASLAPAARNLVTWHFLSALVAALLVLLVHAVALTYFMGTGRWIEETCEAYKLGEAARKENIRLKYRVIPGMVLCIVLVVVTGALGAAADPAANMQLAHAATIHLASAVMTVLANLLVSWVEYDSIARNGVLVEQVVADVNRIRSDRGLATV
jgi:hypothetical protein